MKQPIHALRICALSEKIPWFGQHTGYDLLTTALREQGCKVSEYWPSSQITHRTIGKMYSTVRGWGKRDQSAAYAELRLYASQLSRPDISHILYGESHLSYLSQWSGKMQLNMISTIHLPPSQWSDEMLAHLQHLSSAIVLYRRDIEFFERYIGKGRVRFVHLGSDTNFFCPGDAPVKRRILFAGHYLRNTAMLKRVTDLLLEAEPAMQFDLLVPEMRRDVAGLHELKNYPSVTWHEGLSDEALRSLFQTSYLLLLPMEDSGANTAIVDALSCGLPIVTTDVGGIQDYGGGTIFSTVANNDDEAMAKVVLDYWRDGSFRDQISRACRRYAEENLALRKCAMTHIEVYQELIKN